MATAKTWQVAILEDPSTIVITTDTDDGTAAATGWIQEVDGRLVLTRLEFTAHQPKKRGGITSSTVRAVRLDAGVAQARGHVQRLRDSMEGAPVHPGSEDLVAEWRTRLTGLARAAAKQKAAGRRGYGDDFYRLVAMEYVELTRQGLGGRGVLGRLGEVLARRMGEKHARPRDNVRDWVAESRRRGFLAAGDVGRGGAVPGPRLFDDKGEDQ